MSASHKLLNGYRFREIPGLIDIRPLDQRDMIGKQLQRHDVQHRGQHAVMLGQVQDVDAVRFFDAAVRIGEDIEFAAARPHFLQVGFQFFQQAVVGATAITGRSRSTRASGPCFSTPAA